MSGYYYISNPYNGSQEERNSRASSAAKACAKLIRLGVHAWSPIVHNHAMVQEDGNFTTEERKQLLLPFDFTLLLASKGMIVLKLDGWKESYGVAKEIQLCQEKNLPIYYFELDEILNESEKVQELK